MKIESNYYKFKSDGNDGYFIATSLSGSYYDDRITLCSKYRGIDSEIMSISIDFKIEPFAVPISFIYNSVGIFFTNDHDKSGFSTRFGNSSSNVYRKELKISGLSRPDSEYNSSFTGTIKDNNWYRLEFKIEKLETNKFSVSSKIYDIGAEGASTPVLKSNNTKTGYNYDFNVDNDFNIEFSGGWWGDVRYLDNIKVNGYKNGSNCQLSTSVKSHITDGVNLFPNPFSKELQLNN